jgi:energy-coupling factor transporter transmembrane protein EcfT
MYDRWIHT